MINVDISPGVYDPAEDSHLLLEALKRVVRQGDRVLEVGTGSGMIAIALASMGAEVYASDHDMAACKCALANSVKNDATIRVFRSDLFDGVRGTFDIIAFNPPYLPEEGNGADHRAWTGGERGCEVGLRFLTSAGEFFSKRGRGFIVFSSLGREGEIYRVLDAMYHWSEVASARFDFETLHVAEFRRKESA